MTIEKSYNIQASQGHPFLKQSILLIVIILGFSAFYFTGLSSVPFHPDESTQIFMSQDLDTFFQNPSQLYWHKDQPEDARQRYRLIDAPLTRYLIGVGLKISGEDKHPISDWNWSLSWEENQEAGAHPEHNQLIAARLSVAFLFPFSALLIYLIGKELGGKWTGWLSLFFFFFSALVLIHTRRAMAESALIFSELLLIFLLIKLPSNPGWLGLAAALAFNSKQSTLPLFILGFFTIFFSKIKGNGWKKQVLRLSGYLVIFVLITFCLNPVFWGNPLKAIRASIHSRQELITLQTQDFNKSSGQVLSTPSERVAGLISNLYISPPQVAETGNYTNELQPSVQNYFSNPLNHLFRGFIFGGIFLFASIFGFILVALKNIKSKINLTSPPFLLCLGGMLLVFSILFWIPISLQRYVIPLVPFVCILSAFAIDQLLEIKKRRGIPA